MQLCPFDVEQVVMCVNNHDSADLLTHGQRYRIRDIREGFLFLSTLDGREIKSDWFPWRFRAVEASFDETPTTQPTNPPPRKLGYHTTEGKRIPQDYLT